jgi:two-component system, NarL family, response regulator NreC
MSIKILVVDDHKITRDGLSALIDKQPDMEVVGEASNGREAIELARDMSPDVIIMDISMPDLNGIDATSQILAESPKCKIIALSMYSDSRYVKGMLKAGVSGYLVKSCAFDELVKAITVVAVNQAYLSPGIADMVMKDYVEALKIDRTAPIPESPLSIREREVLQLIAEGVSSDQIASRLHVSIKTVSTHRRNIMEKLNINNIADLIKFALREGLTSI